MPAFTKLKDTLLSKGDFLLICHERPDGDSIGSMIALGEALQNQGKNVVLVSKDPVPAVFGFLLGSHTVQTDFLLGNFEAIILLDNGDLRRTGFADRLLTLKKNRIPIINIDHHPKNDVWRVATINFANSNVASTCELVYQIINELGWDITPKIATALLTGIYTDTGGFQHPNTSPAVLEVASKLLNCGAKLRTISTNISYSHSTAMLKLWGIALNRLAVNQEYGLAYSVLTKGDIEKVNATEDEVSGLVNLINSIPESRAALLLYETKDGKIKGSLRTDSDTIDLSRFAGLMGGGGHRKASGFSVAGKLQEVDGVWQVV